MTNLTADRIIVECLKREGIKYWMGSIGEEQHSILDEIAAEGSIKIFDTRHENTGVIAAIGYSQVTGQPTVCSGTMGAGIANMFNGIYCAFRSHAPVVAIVCKHAPGLLENEVGKGLNQAEAFKSITKWVVNVDRIEYLAGALERALRVATTPPFGPVLVNINKEILSQQGGGKTEFDLTEKGNHKPSSHLTYVDKNLIDQACELLLKSRFPAILVDERVFWNNAETEVATLARLLGIPVCGVGLLFGRALAEEDPLWYGTFRESPMASQLLDQVDSWLVVDCDFALESKGGFTASPLQGIIQIDCDTAYIAKLQPVQLGIVGHSKAVLGQIINRLQELEIDKSKREQRLARLGEEKSRWLTYIDREMKKVKDNVPIHPWELIRGLSDVLPEDGYIVNIGGNIGKFLNVLGSFRTGHPCTVIGGGNSHSLGLAVAKAMGIKLAHPDRAVVALCGDGEFWYGNASELETLKRFQLPIVIVIDNNNCFGINRIIQQRLYGSRYIATNMSNPDFAQLAKVFDMHGERVTKPEDIRPAIIRALNCGKPAIVDVVIDPDAALPTLQPPS